MKYDLSVIIPYYNNASTIEKCLESILCNQINIQIILVNNGSTLPKLAILKKNNIQIINIQENKGVSHARNMGLTQIKAPYFTFVDADDYLEKGAYDTIYKYMKEDSEVVCFNYYEVYQKKVSSPFFYLYKTFNTLDIMPLVLKGGVSQMVWDKIYLTDKFQKYRFDETLEINEDYLYTFNILFNASNLTLINEYVYNYVRNHKSLTNNYTCDLIKNNNYVSKIAPEVINKCDHTKLINYFYNVNMLRLVNQYSLCKDKKNRYHYLKANINRQSLRKLLKYKLTIFKKVEIIVFLISIKLHLMLFPFYKCIRKILRRM